MTASDIQVVAPRPRAAAGDLARLAGTLLCLAAVALLVVVLRFGIYEYFHGEGRVLSWMWTALGR